MRKRILRAVIAAVFICFLCLCQQHEAMSKVAYIEPVVGDPFIEPVKIRCSCYCEHGKTATGAKTRYGIAAGKKEWIGYVAELNAINPDGSVGEFIGYFEFKDTGAGMDSDGDGKGDTIINGQSIDIWINSLPEAYKWRDRYGDYVYIKIVRGKG
jgi:hypothetical protein